MERLWISEPSRRTALAEVTGVRGDWFTVDRALFAPTSRAYRHPQPADKGTIWRDGEKRRLASVRADGWYRLRDTVPEVGERLQCELDQAWRHEISLAHTALHLFLGAVDAPMVIDPEVKGGGHARMAFGQTIAPVRLAAWLQAAQGAIEADAPVEQGYAEAAEAERRVTPQPFDPPVRLIGAEPYPLVTAGATCLVCDGSHVDRTGRIERLVVSHAAWGKDGFIVGLRAT